MPEEELEAAAADMPYSFFQGNVYLCHVTGDGGLNIRTQPNTNCQIVFTASTGSTINYKEKVHGELVNNNDCWGHSVEDHYFWLGGTDSPWC